MLTSRGRYALLLALFAAAPARSQVTFLDTLGTAGAGQLNQPLGLGVGPDGRLFVADGNANRVAVYEQALGSVGFSYAGQIAPAGGSAFNLPADVAVGADGRVYVSDAGNNRVQVFVQAGLGYQSDGLLTPGPLSGPAGLAVAGGQVFVAESFASRVTVVPVGGGPATSFGGQGSGGGETGNPLGVAVAPNGTRYVADTNNSRVAVYDATGTFTGTLGSGLSIPTDLAVAPTGDLYIADTGNNRVRVYSPAGAFKFDLGTGLVSPSDVTVAPTGQIFVSDTLNNRVQRFFNPAEWVSGVNTFQTPVAGAGQLLGQSLTLNAGMTLNSLSALTVQSGGTLVLNGGALDSAGTVGVSGTLTVRAGSSAASAGAVTVAAGGLLNGNGTLNAPVTVAGTIRPGEGGPATLRTGDLTLAAGGRYTWTVAQATGPAGTGFSQIGQSATNSLSVASTAADPFTVRLETVGTLPDFDPTQSYSWAIASFDNVSGFSADKFMLDTSGFANPTGSGSFFLTAQNGQLLLNFSPVPEPALVLAAAAAALAVARRVRR